VTETSGKQPRKLPERADALKVPLDLDQALKAALETPPPTDPKPKRRRRKRSPPS
jgi:hypothetical protein